jgi:GNAT superfamily N-acetyltransferase
MVEYEFVRRRSIINLANVVNLFKQLWPHKKSQDLQEKKKSLWKKSTRIFLAKEDGKVLGLVTFRPKIFGLIAYVPELVVHEEARGKGIGKHLLREIVAYAKKKACCGVFLASAIKRRESHKFYKSNGFINIGSLFFRPITAFA